MQEIKKRRIVLASVLKPVNDPRMFEKMGQSLSAYYEVHIIGTKPHTYSSQHNIVFHPLAPYTRLGIDRILSPLKILRKILYLKPALLVICTHELLWAVLIAKIFLRCPVVYDIRENYFRNILYTNSFPPILRVFIALYVRIKEWITLPAINNYFLAEAGYEKELTFVRKKKIILENKVKKILLQPARKWSEDDRKIHLLFTGTLAPTTGIFVAIDLATKLHAADPNIVLHVVGFSPMANVHQQIKDRVRDKPFILFSESREPISHLDILTAIQHADFGIIAYPPNASTENTIPTKLFEYLGYTLPVLLIDHPGWFERCEPYAAAIQFQLNSIDAGAILRSMKQGTFYSNAPKEVFWESEEDKLLQTVRRLLTIYCK
jgi:glycosyltransferase involved in cell wall biosynthesis